MTHDIILMSFRQNRKNKIFKSQFKNEYTNLLKSAIEVHTGANIHSEAPPSSLTK